MIILENVHMDAIFSDRAPHAADQLPDSPSLWAIASRRVARLFATLKQRLLQGPPGGGAEDDGGLPPYIVPPII